MTDVPERAARAFDVHEAFAPAADGQAADGSEEGTERERTDEDDAEPEGFAVTTTPFEATVTAEETDDRALAYTLTVRVPTIAGAVVGDVGPAVSEGWAETFERRLEDAPGVVRESVELTAFDLEAADEEAVVTYRFELGNADRAPDVVRAFAEYVEGTYVEGVVPGYEYRGVVGELLAEARQAGGDEGSGDPMPL